MPESNIPEEIKQKIEGWTCLQKHPVLMEKAAHYGYSLALKELEEKDKRISEKDKEIAVLKKLVDLKESERKQWADLCIRKAKEIESLKSKAN